MPYRVRRVDNDFPADIIGLQEVMHHFEGRIDQAQDVAAGLDYLVAFGLASQWDDGTRFGNAIRYKSRLEVHLFQSAC